MLSFSPTHFSPKNVLFNIQTQVQARFTISKLPASRTRSAEHQHCQLLESLRHISHSPKRLLSPFIILPFRKGSSWTEIQDRTCITAEEGLCTAGSVPRISLGWLSWVHLSMRQTPLPGMRQEMAKILQPNPKEHPIISIWTNVFRFYRISLAVPDPNIKWSTI